jgi:hypothetical protein
MDLMEIGCDDGMWMELAQDRVQWWTLVLAVLNLRVLLPEKTYCHFRIYLFLSLLVDVFSTAYVV